MVSEASQAVPAATARTDDCRVCRYGQMAVRTATFMAAGVAVALVLAWAAARIPMLGVALGIVSMLLLARTLLMLFVRPNPLMALSHIGVSLGLGIVIAFVVGLLVG